WVAVGDAAMAWDPLSSQGIGKALESALAAAEAIRGALDGRLGALRDYAGGVALSFDQYRRLRTHFYGQVRRWPGAPFGERRQITRHTGLLIEASESSPLLAAASESVGRPIQGAMPHALFDTTWHEA